MLKRLIIYFAYFLKTSPRYSRWKGFFYDLIENPHSRIKSYFDLFMISLVIVSILLLIYETDNKATPAQISFEKSLILVFIVEYLTRCWLFNDVHKFVIDYYEKTQYLGIPFKLRTLLHIVVSKKLEYVLSPLALIDLLAIVPSYREFRILRILIVFRLFKLFRYFNSLKLFAEVLTSKRFELYTLGLFLGFLLLIGSIGFYLFEHHANGGQVNNLFDALYFSVVTLATVGYGDITPQSTGGRIIAMALIMSGLGLLAFFTSIIVTAFTDRMQDLRENKTYAELNRYDNFIIICGFGRVGRHIAVQLQKNNQRFVVIDVKENNLKYARKLNYLVINADASNNRVLLKAGINQGAQAIVCTTGDDVTNVYVTLTSRHLNKNIRIISRANHQENVKKLYQAGANSVIQPFEIAGMVVAEYIGQPVAFEAVLGIVREESHISMDALPVYADCFLVGKSLQELDFPRRKIMLIGVISENPIHLLRKNSYPIQHRYFYFNPEPDFLLQAGDLLVIFGRDLAIDYFHDLIEKSRLKLRRST